MSRGSAHVVEVYEKQTLTPKVHVVFHIQIYLKRFQFRNAKTSDFWEALKEVRKSISPNICFITK